MIKESTNKTMRELITSCYTAFDSGNKELAHNLFSKFSEYVNHVYKHMTRDKFCDADLYGDIILAFWDGVVNGNNRFQLDKSSNCSGWVAGHIHGRWMNYYRKHTKRRKCSTHIENEDRELIENTYLGYIQQNENWFRDYIVIYRKLNKEERSIVKSMLRKEKSGDRAQKNGWSNSKQSKVDQSVRDKIALLLAQ